MAKKEKQPKRSIIIEFDDGSSQELKLAIATSVKTDNNMIYFDQLSSGEWRMIWNKNMIPDFSKVKGLTIKRGD